MSKEQENLRQEFIDETKAKLWAEDINEDVGFSDKYVEWLEAKLTLTDVSNWVAIESEEQPERVTDVMVMYKDNRKEVAFFDGDGRFYTQNDDDITDKIARWHKLP